MPTPLEILLDPISLIIIAMYMVLMFWEAIFPARDLPQVKYWKLKGLPAFAIFFYLSSYLPLITDPYLESFRLFDLTGLGIWGGEAAGLFIYELGIYLWHRAMHRSDFLWRTFHQMHHSAERLDTYGAFFFSPMDMIGWTVLGSICFALLIGITPEAITIVLLVTNFFSIFQHANIDAKLGFWEYIFSIGDNHRYHHYNTDGIGDSNYGGEFIVWDILFGTFHNPRGERPLEDIGIGASPNYPQTMAGLMIAPFLPDQKVFGPQQAPAQLDADAATGVAYAEGK